MKRHLLLRFLTQFLILGLLLSNPAAGSCTENIPATEPTEQTAFTASDGMEEGKAETSDTFPEQWKLYFGLLHAHTAISDGTGSVEEAFSYASRVEGLDFFAVTDHSNSFDNADAGAISQEGSGISEEWAAAKAAAAAVTGEDFVGLYGYEMTWRDDRLLGHINTFATQGWISRNQPGFHTLEAYYEALTAVPGSISQFNHPGPETGDFENFSHWTERYDAAMALLETGDGRGITGENGFIRALDRGWHVAPTVSQNNHNGRWGDADACRTVILAESLTEQCLYDAMAARRVYATEDENLEIWYQLDGKIMGSTVAAEENHTVSLWLRDPEEAGALVEVITDGGAVAASRQAERVPLELTVPGGGRYYYLRITQEDGDVALTAPVWTVGTGNSGISAFTADAQIPEAGEQLSLTLRVRNDSLRPLLLEEVAVYAEDSCIFRPEMPVSLNAGEEYTFCIPFCRETAGQVQLRAVVAGSSSGSSHTWEEALTLTFREREQVSGMLVDGSHAGPSGFDNLAALVEKAGMAMQVFSEEIPEGGDVLVIPPPAIPFEEDFVEAAAEFVREGGLLILSGGGEGDASLQQNRILEAAGFTARFRQDTAQDPVRFGADPWQLHTQRFNSYTSLCRGITEEQFYSHLNGCTIDPGESLWLVRGETTTVSSTTGQGEPVLAVWEEQPGGGRVLAAGSCFFSDEAMPLPDNIWDPPRINQTLLQNLLGYEEERYHRDTIENIRKGTPGTVWRIAGYATSGTSNPNNVFPDTLYLQDDTGGIALNPFCDKGIQTGTYLEVLGALEIKNGKPVLNPISYRTPEQSAYQVAPEQLSNGMAKDYGEWGDCLVQVEATVLSVTLTEDKKGVSRFAMVDSRGDRVTIAIEEAITSGKFGVNNLAKKVKVGRTVRAIGIVDTDENGNSRLRVRNCDEVVHIPPPLRYNPYTGDTVGIPAVLGMAALAGALALLEKLRKMK